VTNEAALLRDLLIGAALEHTPFHQTEMTPTFLLQCMMTITCGLGLLVNVDKEPEKSTCIILHLTRRSPASPETGAGAPGAAHSSSLPACSFGLAAFGGWKS